MGARLIRPGDLPAGAILAGGRATRLGGLAKGLADVGGVRMIDRVAAALRPVVADLLIVSDLPGADTWVEGARVVHDVLAGGGSGAGLHAALLAAERPVIVVAWDMPFIATRALRGLLERTRRREDERTSAFDAIVFGRGDGAFEPLCGWYAPSCVPVIEAAWNTGDRSLHGLLRRVRTVVVPVADLAPYGEPERLFLNVNTPDDLEHARRLAADGAAPRPL